MSCYFKVLKCDAVILGKCMMYIECSSRYLLINGRSDSNYSNHLIISTPFPGKIVNLCILWNSNGKKEICNFVRIIRVTTVLCSVNSHSD